MLNYFLRRLFVMLLMIFLVSTMIFFLFRTMPGDPTAFVVDPSIPSEARQQLLERYGLDGTLWDQYKIFVSDLIRLDFGDPSSIIDRPLKLYRKNWQQH